MGSDRDGARHTSVMRKGVTAAVVAVEETDMVHRLDRLRVRDIRATMHRRDPHPAVIIRGRNPSSSGTNPIASMGPATAEDPTARTSTDRSKERTALRDLRLTMAGAKSIHLLVDSPPLGTMEIGTVRDKVVVVVVDGLGVVMNPRARVRQTITTASRVNPAVVTAIHIWRTLLRSMGRTLRRTARRHKACRRRFSRRRRIPDRARTMMVDTRRTLMHTAKHMGETTMMDR